MEVTDVDGVPTHVFSLEAAAENDTLLYIIPGSPGMGHFYIPFATRLFQLGKGAYDVSVVSHAGHSPGFYKQPDDEGRDWYNLEDQIAHKLAFIEERTRHKKSLYLIGHSIGCYMILKMLNHIVPSRVKKAFFLFPTIEKMASTPNGIAQRPLFTTLRLPFTGVVWLAGGIPEIVRKQILRRWFYSAPHEHVDHICRAVMNIDSKSIYNILSMAEQEMNEVIELPIDIIREHIDKLVFYYGDSDRWNVESCYKDMAERFPGNDINLCSSGHSHAFVISSSDPMAEYVYDKLSKE